ncbi:MAG: ABC transporter substrate-binding protein [Deltaproteobacteria bacterium]|nr:ABC transporter substrate-binding protein [Deltaproteobacteria bacterium]
MLKKILWICMLGCISCFFLQGCAKKEKVYTIGICEFTEDPTTKEAEQGFIQAFIDAGIKPDKDVRFVIVNAQGDFPTVNSIAHKFISEKVDLLCCLATPCLQACMNTTSEIPIVFSRVANPFLAGAGESPTDHLGNVTGVATSSPFEETITLLKELLPEAKVIGTIWTPAELNSEYYMKMQKEAAEKAGLKTVTVPITSTSEMRDAAMSLVSKNIDAIYQISDNLTSLGFEAEVKAANEARIPIFCNQSPEVKRGAAVGFGWDFYDAGYAGGKIAIRVMKGENPRDIPIQFMKGAKLTVNLKAAEIQGLIIPEEVIKMAKEVIR